LALFYKQLNLLFLQVDRLDAQIWCIHLNVMSDIQKCVDDSVELIVVDRSIRSTALIRGWTRNHFDCVRMFVAAGHSV
jgi:hypothetical protein